MVRKKQATVQYAKRNSRKSLLKWVRSQRGRSRSALQPETVSGRVSASTSEHMASSPIGLKNEAQGTSVMLDGTSSEMVLVIQTGGTMDKDYPKREGGYLFEIDTPAAQRVLQRIQPSFPYQLQTVCRKDSQDITQDDRASLADAINQSDAQKVLVTHGTDTIIETASQLAARCPGKTVVLTGSFLPERFKDSDADFNLGFALGALQCLGRRGVFVAMNGRVLPHDAVTRDSQSKNFVEKCRDPV